MGDDFLTDFLHFLNIKGIVALRKSAMRILKL